MLTLHVVLDAIPKVKRWYYRDEDEGAQVVNGITFEFVNAAGKEATEIADEWANVIGENVDEAQYNTALGSVVENLKES